MPLWGSIIIFTILWVLLVLICHPTNLCMMESLSADIYSVSGGYYLKGCYYKIVVTLVALITPKRGTITTTYGSICPPTLHSGETWKRVELHYVANPVWLESLFAENVRWNCLPSPPSPFPPSPSSPPSPPSPPPPPPPPFPPLLPPFPLSPPFPCLPHPYIRHLICTH